MLCKPGQDGRGGPGPGGLRGRPTPRSKPSWPGWPSPGAITPRPTPGWRRRSSLDANQLLARWLRGELHRVAGRLDEAEAAYRWLVDYYNANDVNDAESLRWIGLAAAHYARWNRLSDQFSFLVNELYPDAAEAGAGLLAGPLRSRACCLRRSTTRPTPCGNSRPRWR